MFKPYSALLLAALLCAPALPLPAHASVTLLIPSQPDLEAPQPVESKKPAETVAKKADAAKAAAAAPATPQADAPAPAKAASGPNDSGQAPSGQSASATPAAADGKQSDAPGQEAAPPVPNIGQEVDVLITRMDPFRHLAEEMSMPQLFAVLRFDEHTLPKDGVMQPERVDVLGDVEEAQYLDKKAWGANVALDKPGLYQFIIETRPWWNEAAQRYDQHYVKSFLPVYGVETGWEYPAGLPVEIVSLSRPFGL